MWYRIGNHTFRSAAIAIRAVRCLLRSAVEVPAPAPPALPT